MKKCQMCKKDFELDQLYEYRGFIFCEEHFDEGVKRVDEKRSFVMDVVGKSIESKRKGEFVHNSSKYNLHNVAEDGLPIVKIKEPQVLKDYENGIL